MLSVTEKKYWLDVSSCPLEVWEARYDRGNAQLRKKKVKPSKKAKKKHNQALMDYEAWNILFKSFVKLVGLEKGFVDYVMLQKQLIDAQDAYIQSEKLVDGILIADRKLLILITKLEKKIRDYEKSGVKGQTIDGTLNKISKMQGYRERKKELTVLQYFSLVNDYKTWLKA